MAFLIVLILGQLFISLVLLINQKKVFIVYCDQGFRVYFPRVD